MKTKKEKAALAMYKALLKHYIDACDREETVDEDTGEEFEDYKAMRLALEKAGWKGGQT